MGGGASSSRGGNDRSNNGMIDYVKIDYVNHHCRPATHSHRSKEDPRSLLKIRFIQNFIFFIFFHSSFLLSLSFFL